MEEAPKAQVRKRAALHVVGSGVLAALAVSLLLEWRASGGNLRRSLVIAAALPAAWCLVQLAVLATGVPYVTMARTWDALTGGQRFIMGLAIVAVAAVVLGGVGFAVAISLTGP